MVRQYAVVLVAGLSLVGCGGGGGGGKAVANNGGGGSTSITASQLAGTWRSTTDTFTGAIWDETHHQTISIARVNDSSISQTDCQSGSSSNWTLTNGELTRSGQLTLTVVNANTLTASNSSGSIKKRFTRIDSNAQPVVATANLELDVDDLNVVTSSWTKLCIDSVITPSTTDISFNAATTYSGFPLTVGLNFATGAQFVQATYNFPNTADLSGNYTAPIVGSGTLSDPSGSMNVTIGTSVVFDLNNVEMLSSEDVSVFIDGPISFSPAWLAVPN